MLDGLRREAPSGKGGLVPPRYPWVGVWSHDTGGGVGGPLPFLSWGGGGIPGTKKVAGGPPAGLKQWGVGGKSRSGLIHPAGAPT